MSHIRFMTAVLPVFDPGWKGQCVLCANVIKKRSMLHCAVVRAPVSRRPAACIEARDGACGPTAVLWQRKS